MQYKISISDSFKILVIPNYILIFIILIKIIKYIF